MPGSNEQHRASEPLSEPLASICHLFVNRRRGVVSHTDNNSTGVLIRGRYVLTAAHNVHSTFWSKVLSIDVSIGKASADAGETLQVERWEVASGYGWRDFERDYAVLLLPEEVAIAQPLGFSTVSSATEIEGVVHLAGYPGGSGGERDGKTLFTGTGRARYVPGSAFVDYDIDTETGNSGGPVWIDDSTGRPSIVGVHVTEIGDHGRARVADAGFVQEVERMIARLS